MADMRLADSLRDRFEKLGLPKNRVMMLHVRIKELQTLSGLPYKECAKQVIEAMDSFAPLALLVPAFTYSFTKSGVYHRLFSRSETGRFSEEVRQHFARYRTMDPLFSVMDVKGWLEAQTDLQWDRAFGPSTVWEAQEEHDALIVNIGIESMVATQVHHIECTHDVSYRFNKMERGVAFSDTCSHEHVEYTFFARYLKQNRLLNWPKIESYLDGEGVFHATSDSGTKLAWLSAREMAEACSRALQNDHYFLVSDHNEEGEGKS